MEDMPASYVSSTEKSATGQTNWIGTTDVTITGLIVYSDNNVQWLVVPRRFHDRENSTS